ncbi:MAG TPA: hypothetical protein VIM11_16740, partial [Tepidisphaeraceae bacterium]
MSLDAKVLQRLTQALAVVDEHGTVGPRLVDDAVRLFARIGRFVSMKLVAEGIDSDALELACYAMQLQSRRIKSLPTGRVGRTSLREKAEEAAELLLEVDLDVEEELLDRTARILHEMPHRSPMLDEAKLLADAVNLDDFGVTGLIQQVVMATRQGDGILQLADGLQKREQYGYWEARLKDGFHFEPVRQIARKRLDNARHVALLLV